jgi:hypothetical protein
MKTAQIEQISLFSPIVDTFMPSEVPETSKMAFKTIKQDGTLSKCQQMVIEALRGCQTPLTANEICGLMGHPGLWKRVSELERSGQLQKCDMRTCKITGKMAYTWKLA